MQERSEHIEPPDVADVPTEPPTLFLSALAAGCVLELIWPLGPGLASGTWKPVAIGLFFALLGVFFGWRSVARFNEAETSFIIHEPTNALVTAGIYRLSRNPIYIGLVTLYFGLSLMLTSVWCLILLPVLVGVLQKTVIEREEAFLEGKFGDAYTDYKATVPRWL